MSDYLDIFNNLKQTPPRKLNDHIVLVDAMNMLIRSFTMVQSLNPSGSHTGGLIGFMRSLGFINRTLDPTRIIIVWDGKGGSMIRKNLDPNYKAHRAGTRITNWGMFDDKKEESEALTSQIFRTQDYLQTLPVTQLLMDKLEADDIIAYLALFASNKQKKVTIVSSDKDFMQLVDPYIHIYSPIKKVTYDYRLATEDIKVLPENYNIVKALLGDSSDNLAGVKGVGLKTIVKEFPELLTNKNATLQYIYDVCEKNLNKKIFFAKILHEWDKVERNFEMMDLHKTILSEREKEEVKQEIVVDSTLQLQTGGFMRLMEQDQIEGITKNTELWLEGFNNLLIKG